MLERWLSVELAAVYNDYFLQSRFYQYMPTVGNCKYLIRSVRFVSTYTMLVVVDVCGHFVLFLNPYGPKIYTDVIGMAFAVSIVIALDHGCDQKTVWMVPR